MAEKIGYKPVASASTLIKSGPAGFFGLIVVASATGSVTIYDNTSATGKVLFTKASLAVGEILSLGAIGIAAENGLFVVATNATVNVQFI